MSIRHYGAEGHAHSHDLPYFVLPLRGALEIEVEGRGALLDRTRAACVAAGARHAHANPNPNAFLVIELQPDEWDEAAVARLAQREYLQVTPEAGHLIDYMGHALARGLKPTQAALWRPLLLDALLDGATPQRSRLAHLLAGLDDERALGWGVAQLAAHTHLSTSRLHALFRAELDTTPRAWLAQRRLDRARRWLAETRLPLAQVAQRAGYVDQSALSHAFRDATGLTPGAYRRQRQEPGTKA